MRCILLLCLFLGAAANDVVSNLQDHYPFSEVLLEQSGRYYELYWNFCNCTETIYFAVNVSTTGWVGFGLSPDGSMPGSDVVIGWVTNTGESHFWVSEQ